MSNPTLIWTKGLRGPAPEIWYDLSLNRDSHDKELKPILQKHELPTEYKDLTLNQLAMIYPYKGMINET